MIAAIGPPTQPEPGRAAVSGVGLDAARACADNALSARWQTRTGGSRTVTTLPSCIKAYDIRGRVPEDLDADLAHRLGRALAAHVGAGALAVGRDCRTSSPSLADAVAAGLAEGGCDVRDIGLCATEQVYHAVIARGLAGGVMVTASHNPLGWNGMKIVAADAVPISGDSGLHAIGRAAVAGDLPAAAVRGRITPLDTRGEFRDFLLGCVDAAALPALTVVADAGHGCAGPVLDLLEPHLPLKLIKLRHEPDGTFPTGVPNPLLPENRALTAAAVREHGADLGLAWDGDADRCFFFDEHGDFVEGYYLVGLLARAALRREPGGRIVHDPRLVWNTVETVREAGGVPLQNKTGHAFMKERMRAEDAVYGGEMSAHHYFREFRWCDSGMLPWLRVLEEMGRTGSPLSALVGRMQGAYPASGEINRRLADPQRAVAAVADRWLAGAAAVDRTDGLSLDLGTWRLNLRESNTEPVLRLNVEARGDAALMREMTDAVLAVIDGAGGAS
ncbi:MAG: phosphomannomutase [bacterium]|nr:phosphomannomutase [bacterium]